MIAAVAVPLAAAMSFAVAAPVSVRTARVAPFAFAITLFPFAAFPIAMTVVVTLAIPAGTNDDHRRRRIHRRRRRRVNGLGRIHDARNADVHADVDVSERRRRRPDADTGDDRNREQAAS